MCAAIGSGVPNIHEYYRSLLLPIVMKLSFLAPEVVEVHLYNADPSGRAVYGRSLAGIAGSNPVGGMDVCLL